MYWNLINLKHKVPFFLLLECLIQGGCVRSQSGEDLEWPESRTLLSCISQEASEQCMGWFEPELFPFCPLSLKDALALSHKKLIKLPTRHLGKSVSDAHCLSGDCQVLSAASGCGTGGRPSHPWTSLSLRPVIGHGGELTRVWAPQAQVERKAAIAGQEDLGLGSHQHSILRAKRHEFRCVPPNITSRLTGWMRVRRIRAWNTQNRDSSVPARAADPEKLRKTRYKVHLSNPSAWEAEA